MILLVLQSSVLQLNLTSHVLNKSLSLCVKPFNSEEL